MANLAFPLMMGNKDATDAAFAKAKHTVSLRTQAAFAGSNTPVYERFFAGGFNSIRGFQFRGVGPNVNGFLVDRSHPARSGDTVVIYCAGLGAVDQPVSVTQPAPPSPLSNTIAPVTVTVGGQKAVTAFAGLTPGFTGLYQINALIPGGIVPGDAVEVTIAVA